MKNKGGRPIGSRTKQFIGNFITQNEVADLVEVAKKQAKKGDVVMIKFLLEQVFGKAIQPVEGNFTGNLKLAFDKTFQDGTSNSASKTTGNNTEQSAL